MIQMANDEGRGRVTEKQGIANLKRFPTAQHSIVQHSRVLSFVRHDLTKYFSILDLTAN